MIIRKEKSIYQYKKKDSLEKPFMDYFRDHFIQYTNAHAVMSK